MQLVVGNSLVSKELKGKGDDRKSKWQRKVEDTDDPRAALTFLRGAISVIRYMDRRASPPVNDQIANMTNLIQAE